jgi:hypothetical protein
MKTQGEIEAAISEGGNRFEQDYMGQKRQLFSLVPSTFWFRLPSNVAPGKFKPKSPTWPAAGCCP